MGSWDQPQVAQSFPGKQHQATQGPRRQGVPGVSGPAPLPSAPRHPAGLLHLHPRAGAPGWVAAARGGADWFRFQIWPRPGLGARARLAALREPAEGTPGGRGSAGTDPTPPPASPAPRHHSTKAAPDSPGARPCAPGSPLGSRVRFGGAGARPSDRTPGWSPGGGLPHRAGAGAGGGAGALTWTGRQTDAPRQTDALEDGPPDGQGFGHGGLAAPAPGPEWIPSRERQIEREGRRRRRRRRRPGEGRGGGRERASRGGARQAAGRGRRKRAGTGPRR